MRMAERASRRTQRTKQRLATKGRQPLVDRDGAPQLSGGRRWPARQCVRPEVERRRRRAVAPVDGVRQRQRGGLESRGRHAQSRHMHRAVGTVFVGVRTVGCVLLAARRAGVRHDPFRPQLGADREVGQPSTPLHGLCDRRRKRTHQDSEDSCPEVEDSSRAASHGRSIEAQACVEIRATRNIARSLVPCARWASPCRADVIGAINRRDERAEHIRCLRSSGAVALQPCLDSGERHSRCFGCVQHSHSVTGESVGSPHVAAALTSAGAPCRRRGSRRWTGTRPRS